MLLAWLIDSEVQVNHHNINKDCATIKTCWKEEQEGWQGIWLEERSVSFLIKWPDP